MEESRINVQIQFGLQSQLIPSLTISIQNSNKLTISSFELGNHETHTSSVENVTRNIYIHFVSQDRQIEEKLHYKFSEESIQFNTISLQKLSTFFKVNMCFKINPNQFFSQQSKHQAQILARQNFQKIKDKIFNQLQLEKFFIDKKSQGRMKYIRKPKGKKNLTTILFGKSTVGNNSNHSQTELSYKKKKLQSQLNLGQKTPQPPSLGLVGLFQMKNINNKKEKLIYKGNNIENSQNDDFSLSIYPCLDEKVGIEARNIQKRTVSRVLKKMPPKYYKNFIAKLEEQTKKQLGRQKQALSFLHLININDLAKQQNHRKSQKISQKSKIYIKRFKVTI